jgi:hypothetical protein
MNTNKAFRAKPVAINLAELNLFENGAVVSPTSLVANGLLQMKNGKFPTVKIMATGTSDKKLSFENVEFSAAAKAKLGL